MTSEQQKTERKNKCGIFYRQEQCELYGMQLGCNFMFMLQGLKNCDAQKNILSDMKTGLKNEKGIMDMVRLFSDRLFNNVV